MSSIQGPIMTTSVQKELLQRGFVSVGTFAAGTGKLLELAGKTPDKPGVYVFVRDSIRVEYVGMSVSSLRARPASYTRPRKAYKRQIFTLIRDALDEGAVISVLVATPEPMT